MVPHLCSWYPHTPHQIDQNTQSPKSTRFVVLILSIITFSMLLLSSFITFYLTTRQDYECLDANRRRVFFVQLLKNPANTLDVLNKQLYFFTHSNNPTRHPRARQIV